MPRTVTQAAWDLHKELQRAERRGIRRSVPTFTAHDAAEAGRAVRRKARRASHKARRSTRVSPEHHAARVESKRRAHK